MENKKIYKNQLNYGILLPVFLLCIIGVLSLYVALYHDSYTSSDITKNIIKQIIWYGLGFSSAIIIYFFNPKILWRLTPILYGLCIVILLLLLKFYNPQLALATGAKNWFYIAGFSFQPTELAKIGYILMLARITVNYQQKSITNNLKEDWIYLFKTFITTLPLGILLYLQNDLGTMLVFFAIYIFILFTSNINIKILTPIIAIGTILVLIVLYLIISETGREFLLKIGFHKYQFERINSWLNPFIDSNGASYQLSKSLIAIGSGGLFGTGFNVSNVHVPVRESDMIFSVIGENFGFIGSCFVIFLYFYLIYQMYKACFKSNNLYFTYIGIGIVAMIFFHVFENIGASIGLLPLTGIPLPYISQGGSAIISNFLGLGFMLCCSRYSDKKSIRQK
ncbi:TPA: FtsW/RodA/SpoVE family cell cycle protein [Enterococcus hirae]